FSSGQLDLCAYTHADVPHFRCIRNITALFQFVAYRTNTYILRVTDEPYLCTPPSSLLLLHMLGIMLGKEECSGGFVQVHGGHLEIRTMHPMGDRWDVQVHGGHLEIRTMHPMGDRWEHPLP